EKEQDNGLGSHHNSGPDEHRQNGENCLYPVHRPGRIEPSVEFTGIKCGLAHIYNRLLRRHLFDARIGERLAIKLKTMINQVEAEFLGDLVLQFLDLIAGELDHLPGLNIDQMIVMLIRYFLVAGAAVAKIVALEN